MAIGEVIPEFSKRIEDSIDPAWVAAIGSARRWKETKHRDSHKMFNMPSIEGDDEAEMDNTYHRDPQESHDQHSEL